MLQNHTYSVFFTRNLTCPPKSVMPIFVDTKDHKGDTGSRLYYSLKRNGCQYMRLGGNYNSKRHFSWNVKVGEKTAE